MHPMLADTMTHRPAAVRVGIAAALVLAALYLAAIPWSPLRIVPALVLLGAALGLRKGHAWSGYGGALFLAARFAGGLVSLARIDAAGAAWGAAALVAAVIGAVAYLLFRAAGTLSESGPSKSKWAWIALAIAAFLASQSFTEYMIPTGAMEDTLLIGDQLLATTLGTPAPARGGVIVFRYPADIRQTFAKRCIGLPGDRIKLVDKQVYLNGKKLDEPYVSHKTAYIDSYRDNFPGGANIHLPAGGRDMLDHHVVDGEVVVPPDSYFAMGDNRDASLDSRYWGFVPRANLTGTPWIVDWSYGPADAQASSNRYLHFFTKTRWRRILMPVQAK
jgi:signal peptidase I